MRTLTSKGYNMKYRPINSSQSQKNRFRMRVIPVDYHTKMLLHEKVTWEIFDNLEEIRLSLGMWFDDL
jgi:hypothetical protein